MLLLAVLVALAAPAAAAPQPTFRSCSRAEAGAAVRAFVDAFDRGQGRRLDSLFARDEGDGDAATPSFQWYSTGPPGSRAEPEANNRKTLVPYLLRRHRHGERLRIVELHIGESSHGYSSFGFHVHRSARDLRRPGVFEGKGAAICPGGRALIAVWSLGGRVAAG